MARPRLLIVDDHDDTREAFAWCMRASGWQVEEVTDGSDALDRAAAFEPDVIVMDLHLPVIDGLEATRLLKSDDRTAHIPVVACTAFARAHQLEVQTVGFDQLVSKPCSPEDLRVVLENLVAGRDPA